MLNDWTSERGRKAIEKVGDVYGADLLGVDWVNDAAGDRVVLAMRRDRAREWLAKRCVHIIIREWPMWTVARLNKTKPFLRRGRWINPFEEEGRFADYDSALIAAVLATKEAGNDA